MDLLPKAALDHTIPKREFLFHQRLGLKKLGA